jgi:hypothetical protein
VALQVSELIGFRQGFTAFFALVAVFAAVLVAALGWIGLSNTVERMVDQRVQQSVSDSTGQLLENLTARLEEARAASVRAQVEAQAASDSAASAQAALQSINAVATHSAAAMGQGEWIVSYSSVDNVDDALIEVNRGLMAGYTPSIYHFGGGFNVAIGPFPERNSAETARPALVRTLGGNAIAYNLSIHCPASQFVEGLYYECALLPSSTSTP